MSMSLRVKKVLMIKCAPFRIGIISTLILLYDLPCYNMQVMSNNRLFFLIVLTVFFACMTPNTSEIFCWVLWYTWHNQLCNNSTHTLYEIAGCCCSFKRGLYNWVSSMLMSRHRIHCATDTGTGKLDSLNWGILMWKEFCKQGIPWIEQPLTPGSCILIYAVNIQKGHEQVRKKIKNEKGVGMTLDKK